MTSTITRAQLNAEHATLAFLLWAQYDTLYHRQLKIEHSLNDGFYCTDLEKQPITDQMCKCLQQGMKLILNSGIPFEFPIIRRDELINHFLELKMVDKVGALKSGISSFVKCVRINNSIDYLLEPMSTNYERLKIFDIHPFKNGIIIRFPSLSNPNSIGEYHDPEILNGMFSEYENWCKLVGIEYAYQLNNVVFSKAIKDTKWVAEGLHDEKIDQISDKLCENLQQNPKRRLVSIGGPISSGKKTFALRLHIALQVNGYESVVLHMKDFAKDSSSIKKSPDGFLDFVDISSIDIDLLTQRCKDLLDGKSVPTRKYSTQNGCASDDPNKLLHLSENGFLIVSGFHGIHPNFLENFDKSILTTIYVSCLTPLNIDCNHRFPTSDLRLIRKIISDFRSKICSPRQTLKHWTYIMKNEISNVFNYQQNCDMFFNSAIVYEISVLSIFAKSILSEATLPEPGEDPESPEVQEISCDANRLQELLSFFYPVADSDVPHISCIREFIGGSDLKY